MRPRRLRCSCRLEACHRSLIAQRLTEQHRVTIDHLRHDRSPAPVVMDELDARLHRIGQHHLRAKFRLRGRDRAVVDLRGIATVRRHAEELVERRLAPAEPIARQKPPVSAHSFSTTVQHNKVVQSQVGWSTLSG